MVKIKCRDAARIINQAMEEPISPVDRIALRAHLKVCGMCRYYLTQMRLLRRAIRRRCRSQAGFLSDSSTSLSPEARERIRRSLKEEQE